MIAHALRAEGFDASEDGTGRGTPLVPVSVGLRGRDGGAAAEMGDDKAFTLRASGGGGDKPHVLTSTLTSNGDAHSGFRDEHELVPVSFSGQMSTPSWQSDRSETLQAKNPRAVAYGSAVRRLTPLECERLQGFPDGHTLVPYRNGMMADGNRYKMLGNSMAVPVMSWLGRRIAEVDAS